MYLARGIKPGFAGELVAAAERQNVPVEHVPRRWLDDRAGGATHQGVMIVAEPLGYADVDAVLAGLPDDEAPFLIALDQVQDPHNLGAIIRTAAAAGAHGLVLPARRAAGLGPGALKAAAGAAEWFPVARVVNLGRELDRLKKRGLWICGADGTAPQSAWGADLRGPLVLVVGGEDRGLGRLIRDKCDYLVRLPMHPRVQSLNSSVAAGVLIYEVIRQRQTVK